MFICSTGNEGSSSYERNKRKRVMERGGEGRNFGKSKKNCTFTDQVCAMKREQINRILKLHGGIFGF